MAKENNFLIFAIKQDTPSKKTSTWIIHSTQNSFNLGEVRWYAPWRKYCLFPYGNTIWDTKCMEQILNFIKEKMEERNAKTSK